MPNGVTDSRFNMWRAIVAIAHVDGILTPHEVSFMNLYEQEVDFTKRQAEILANDFKEQHCPEDLYGLITDKEDKVDFFALARALSWCDGSFTEQEKHIIEILKQRYFDETDAVCVKESRNIVMQEVELRADEWIYKNDHGRRIFGFLKKIISL